MVLLRTIVWPFFRATKRPLLLFGTAFLAVVATAMSHVATPWLIGRLIDAAPQGDLSGLRTAVAGLFAVAVLASLGGGTRALAARRLADLFRTHLRTNLMRQLLRLRLADVEGQQNRQLNSVFTDDVPAVANLANPLGLNVFLALVQLIAALVILMMHFTSFAWLVLIVVPVNAAIGIWQWPLALSRARASLQDKTRLDSLTVQVVEGMREVKGLAADRSVMGQLAALSTVDLAGRWRAYIVQSVDHVRYTASWAVMAPVYMVGGLAVARGELTIGSLTAFVWYVGFLETPISRLWQAATEWQASRASLERYAQVMSLPTEADGEVTLVAAAPPDVEFRDLTFHYPGSATPALSGINLTLAAGQEIAVVGASGAGKTTFVSLILRLFDPDEGAVSIAGVDVRRYTLASLRRYVAIISQDPFLFDGTVRENICIGLDECTEAEVQWAAEVADAHRFITEMPDGYDTVLGARGTRLSGGQKRRLAIARAIIRRPRILVLDEVTGALDSISDIAIQRAIDRVRDGCTTITVSHRLSSTAHADKIVVFEEGRVIGTGTHQQLLRDCPSYRRLSELQALEQADEPGIDIGGLDPAAVPLPAGARVRLPAGAVASSAINQVSL
jgi:ABC-type multidrug transport system fused ATPase/permease subunit